MKKQFKLPIKIWLFMEIINVFSLNAMAGDQQFTIEKEKLREISYPIKATNINNNFSHKNLDEAINISKAIILDNITWIEGLYEVWSKPQPLLTIEDIESKTSLNVERKTILNNINIVLQITLNEKKEWQKLMLTLDQLKSNKSDLVKILNYVFDFYLLQQSESICFNDIKIRDQRESDYFSGMEKNTKAQASSLMDIINCLLPFTSSLYQQDYNKLSLEVINSYSINGTNSYLEPVKKNSFLEFNIGRFYGARYKFKLPLSKKLEINSFFQRSAVNNSLLSNLKIRFEESNLELLCRDLPFRMGEKYVADYSRIMASQEKVAKLKARRNNKTHNLNIIKFNLNSLNTEDKDKNNLVENICGKLGKNNKKEKKNIKGKGKIPINKTKEDVLNTTFSDLSLVAHSEPSQTLTHDNCIKPQSLNVPNANNIDPLQITPNVPRTSNLSHDLKYKTLALAARQNRTCPLSIDEYVETKSCALKNYYKTILANLLKINNDGNYGELKASHTYNWDDLVGLLKGLGFTMSRNHLFTFSPAQQIRLHYLHYDDKRLNSDLLGIMFKQLDNIGFTREYLIALLKD